MNPGGMPLRLTFTRARGDVTYTVEASGNLRDWQELVTNPGTVGQEVTVTDHQAGSPRFLRLRITQP